MSAAADITIRPATGAEVIELRHAILRAGLARETAMFPGDDDPSARHFVAESNGRIVGCVTLHLNSYEGEAAWQLRGMAVAAELQGRGVGARLLAAAEGSVAESAPTRLMWCNARTPAAGFYIRLGWRVVSAEFEVPTAGPHVKMLKRIEPHVR